MTETIMADLPGFFNPLLTQNSPSDMNFSLHVMFPLDLRYQIWTNVRLS